MSCRFEYSGHFWHSPLTNYYQCFNIYFLRATRLCAITVNTWQTYHKLFDKFALSRPWCGLLQFCVMGMYITCWYNCFWCLVTFQYRIVHERVLVLGGANMKFNNMCLGAYLDLVQMTLSFVSTCTLPANCVESSYKCERFQSQLVEL